MAYQSLYRKYRPQTFADVVGQGHVVRTLQNALASGRVAHGYLFTGTRGTAKTTVARLLAKSLNCLAQDGPTTEPCNTCDACLSIMSGSCIDVIEMDAASHRGVADIEEVRKAVGYGPMQFRYKVFIIDEAHQLSSDAKDAFLKTLEEPPPGVVFILATTEPQAIPITIRSRCQQFDFKRGSLADITARLRYVLDAEGVSYTSDAVNLVARGAEGSYRDALSLLEQVLAFTPKQVAAADVEAVLGALDAEQLARVVDAIARRDAAGALALASEILDSGKEARTLLKTLVAHFRDLLLVAVGGSAAAAELTPEEVTRLQTQVRHFAPAQLLQAMDKLNEALGETRWNNQHRLLVDLTLLKLMALGDGPAVAFEPAPIVFAEPATVKVPTAPPSAKAKPVAKPAPPTPEPEPEPEVLAPEPELEAAPTLGAEYFADEADLGDDDEEDYAPESLEPEPEPTVAPEPEAEPEVAVKPTARGGSLFDDDEEEEVEPEAPQHNDGLSLFDAFEEPAAPAPAPVEATPAPVVIPEPEPVAIVEDDFPPLPDDELEPEPAPAPVVAKPAPVVVPAPEPEPEPEPEEEEVEAADPRITLDRVQQSWPRFLADAEKISMQTSVMMNAAIPVAVEGRTVVLSFTARMNYDMMNAPKKIEFVRKLLARVLDVESVGVRLTLDKNAPPPPQRAVARQKVRHDPMAALDALPRTEPQDAMSGGAAGWTPPPALPTPRPQPQPRRESLAPSLPPTHPEDQERSVRAGSRTEKALAEPLVQEILSTFGGEIVEEE